MKWMTAALLLLACVGTAQASKKCGNSYIADNKTCRIGTSTPYTPPYTPAPVRAAPAPAVPRVGFASCDAAQAAGYSDMPTNSLHYQLSLDRDRDGIACESGGEGEAPVTASTSTDGASTETVASAEGIEYVDLTDFCLQNGVTMGSDGGKVTMVKGAITVRIAVNADELNLNGLYIPMQGKLIGKADGFAAPLADMKSAFAPR